MDVKRIAAVVTDGISTVGSKRKAFILPHLRIIATHDDFVRSVDHIHLAVGLSQAYITIIENGIRTYLLVFVLHERPFVEVHKILIDKIIAVCPFQNVLFIDDGGRAFEPHFFDVRVII